MASSETTNQAELLRLVEQALELPPNERHLWLKQKVSPQDYQSIRRLLAKASEDTQGVWASPPFQHSRPSMIGRKIGPYEIKRRIAAGGMAQVFQAQRVEGDFHQKVAIKILMHNLDSISVLEHFEIERQILADLDHPNIARLLDGGTTEDDIQYVVMEYVDGVHLNNYFDPPKNLRELKNVVQLFIKIAQGLSVAHRAAIIHRDIKPSNIIVTKQAEPKLLDFGIAKILKPDYVISPKNTIVGALTPAYASPEQIEGKNITTTSDVYSLGICLFEVFTGYKPYDVESQTPVAAFTTIKSWLIEFTDKQKHLPTIIPDDLANIMRKCVAVDPEQRYLGAAELAEDLQNFLEDRPVRAKSPTASYRLRKFVRRNQLSAIAALTALVSLIAALGLSIYQTREANHLRALAEAQLSRAETVSRYLGDLLLSPSVNWDSRIQVGPNASVRDLLIAAEAQLMQDLFDLPDVRVELLNKISEARSRMGDHDAAIRIQTENVAWAKENLPIDSPVLEDAIYFLGAAHHNDLRFEGTFKHYLEVLERADARNLPLSLRQAYVTNDIAMAYAEQSQWISAVTYQGEALSMIARLGTSDEAAVWTPAYYNFGYYLYQAGQIEQAEDALRKALTIHQIQPDITMSPASKAYLRLARLVMFKNQTNSALLESEGYAREALRLSSQLAEKGSDHSTVILTAGTLAQVLILQNRFQEAYTLIEEIEEKYPLWKDKGEARYLAYARAKIHLEQSDLEHAKVMAERALELHRAGTIHPEDSGPFLKLLAEIYGNLGLDDQAINLKNASKTAYDQWREGESEVSKEKRDV
ncbi:MAG: protein kinase [Pseudomonadota bacterium]